MGTGSLTMVRMSWRPAAAVVVLLALATGCGTSPPGSAPPPTADSAVAPSTDPLAGLRFYVNETSQAARQEAQWRAGGRNADADRIAKIAGQPQGTWLTPDPGRVRQDAHALAAAAAAVRQTPLVVVYNLPHRDCTGYSAGGAADAPAYRAWLASLASGLGHSAPVVILEPDAIPGALGTCLTATQRNERFGLLAAAVATLTSQTGAHVYLDAGNPGWIQDAGALAAALRSAGIGHAAGFVLNVANFYTTASSIAYGHQIAQQLGGAHFVIDTSRNGNGPATDDGTGAPRWCNPPGRALGHPPTANTGDPQVDALLWVKNPGESDGNCRLGAPVAGQWWPQYALQLAAG
ncbi:MAG TPA: glycoside hydrolase family 6 protein [Pseudonocardiaceae bacterium]